MVSEVSEMAKQGDEMSLTAITTFANWSNSDICEWIMLDENELVML